MKNKLNEIEILNKLDKDYVVDWGLDMMNTRDVWSVTKGEGVKVAVIDTGIDYNHVEFSNKNIINTINMQARTKNVDDMNGHGTCVASLIAGKNVGVAPDVELYIAQVLDKDGKGRAVDIMNGINYAIENNVDILCMSLGTITELPSMIKERIIQAHRKGIIMVCASGNEGKKNIEYPACYDEVIAVGGIDREFQPVSFSNYGKQLDILAPSVEILGAYKDNKYVRMTGTSFASPLVAGTLALLISYSKKQEITLTVNDIRTIFQSLGDGKKRLSGYGIINAKKVIESFDLIYNKCNK